MIHQPWCSQLWITDHQLNSVWVVHPTCYFNSTETFSFKKQLVIAVYAQKNFFKFIRVLEQKKSGQWSLSTFIQKEQQKLTFHVNNFNTCLNCYFHISLLLFLFRVEILFGSLWTAFSSACLLFYSEIQR